MDTQRLHIHVPKDLVARIDALAGERGRSTFFVEVAEAEVRRRSMLSFLDKLEREGPVWKDEDHPELVRLGPEGYVRQLRGGKSARKKWLEKNWTNRK